MGNYGVPDTSAVDEFGLHKYVESEKIQVSIFVLTCTILQMRYVLKRVQFYNSVFAFSITRGICVTDYFCNLFSVFVISYIWVVSKGLICMPTIGVIYLERFRHFRFLGYWYRTIRIGTATGMQ